MFINNKKIKGTCTMCGKENCELTIIDDEERVCDECLDNEFYFCDECQEYWQCNAIEFYHLKDGRILCEYCGEDVDSDEVEEIEDSTI